MEYDFIYIYTHVSICIILLYTYILYVYGRARVSVHFVSANLCTIIVLLLVLWYSGYKGKRRLLALYNIITGHCRRCRLDGPGPTLYFGYTFFLRAYYNTLVYIRTTPRPHHDHYIIYITFSTVLYSCIYRRFYFIIII